MDSPGRMEKKIQRALLNMTWSRTTGQEAKQAKNITGIKTSLDYNGDYSLLQEVFFLTKMYIFKVMF